MTSNAGKRKGWTLIFSSFSRSPPPLPPLIFLSVLAKVFHLDWARMESCGRLPRLEPGLDPDAGDLKRLFEEPLLCMAGTCGIEALRGSKHWRGLGFRECSTSFLWILSKIACNIYHFFKRLTKVRRNVGSHEMWHCQKLVEHWMKVEKPFFYESWPYSHLQSCIQRKCLSNIIRKSPEKCKTPFVKMKAVLHCLVRM